VKLGIHLTLLIGPTVAVPVPSSFTEALDYVEVTHSDTGRSGFELRFQIGRSGPLGQLDFPLSLNPLLRPFNRVIVVVTFSAMPRVLMDGIITNLQTSPGTEPGASLLTIIGEDVSIMMDQKEVPAEHPAQDDTIIALKTIAKYARFGLIPIVIPPPVIDPPVPIERIPVQQRTDYAHLTKMARRYGYVFHVTPGPAPFTNFAYWGPPIRTGVPQRALSINMGAQTNVDSINFQHNALAPTTVSGTVQDRNTNQQMPVQTFISTRPPLALMPSLVVNQPNVRNRQFRATGQNTMQAYAQAQGTTEASVDNVVTASGALDALRYGDLLRPRGLVGLRGAGFSYDGFWYVKSVTHAIRKGEYKQRFSLAREGVGSTTPVVIP
jgi:hypothetical protein